jgi:hypothetical protein
VVGVVEEDSGEVWDTVVEAAAVIVVVGVVEEDSGEAWDTVVKADGKEISGDD